MQTPAKPAIIDPKALFWNGNCLQRDTFHGRHRGKTVSFASLQIFPSAAVAQWIEYWPPKPRVVGSIPASRTTENPPNRKRLASYRSPMATLHRAVERSTLTGIAFGRWAGWTLPKWQGPVTTSRRCGSAPPSAISKKNGTASSAILNADTERSGQFDDLRLAILCRSIHKRL